jgi:hypothetical protein
LTDIKIINKLSARKNLVKVEENLTKGVIYKVLCQQCKHETNHIVLYSIKSSGSELWGDDAEYQWVTTYEVVKCQGCDEISFRQCDSDSESYDEEGYYSTITLYPKRTKETINIKSYHSIPHNIKRLYQETINCYNNDIMTLCAAGVRALVEGICLNKKIKDGEISYLDKNGNIKTKRSRDLQGKINGLYENGILTKDNAASLNEHRYLGNEAIHELSLPSKEELSLAITIIEHILDSIYEIPIKTFELQEARKKNKTI